MTAPKISRDEILRIYKDEGALAAADAAGVSKRTVQRWVAEFREGNPEFAQYVHPVSRLGHGTAACYARGCRREECKEANREAQRQIKARRVRRYQEGKIKIVHGVSGYSNWDCRCVVCKKAWSKYLRDRRNGIDTGTE